jgi:4-amino-4-deoxy-L-arabinose transferase-like glycosyltransferase
VKLNNSVAEQLLVMLAFLLATFLIFARLGSLPLMLPDEGRNAEVAGEMTVSCNRLIPTYNGLPYLDKPAHHATVINFMAGWSGALLPVTGGS